jgi:hypothetical protein
MPEHRFVLRLPPDIFRKMDAIGRIHSQDSFKKRSINDEIVDACRSYIAQFEQDHGEITFIYHYIIFASDEAAQAFRDKADLSFAGLDLASHLPEGEDRILTYTSPRPLTPYEQERFETEIEKVEGVLEYTLNLEN